MKKHLIAAAALATLSTAAFAQNVTMYGFIDMGVFTTNNGNTSGQRLTTLDQAGGNYFPTMFGFTGSEDLGGGLKAGFNLQSSFKANSGALSGGNLFDRYSVVSLSGAAGTVELGRQLDPMFLQSFVNGAMPSHANSLAVHNIIGYSTGVNATATVYGTRFDNAVTYTTPTLNGLNAKLTTALGGQAGDSGKNTLYNGIVNYTVGGLNLNAAYQTQDVAGVSDGFEKTLVAAKYTVGDLTVAAQYIGNRNKSSSGVRTINVDSYEAGFGYKLTPALTAGLNYEYYDNKATGRKPSILSAKSTYSLSKRTYLYATAASYNGAASQEIQQGYLVNGVVGNGAVGGSALAANKTSTNLAVGVVHGF